MHALRLTQFSSLRALSHPEFAAVWLGALVSTLGTWMETIALGVYVTRTTGRAEWTGGIAALTYLPALVLAPLGGALADRFDRRTYVALGTLAQALLAGVLAALAFSQRLSVEAVALVSFLNGCVSTLAYPAFVALMSGLVPPPSLHSAMSLNSAQFNLGRILGPLLAALVLDSAGIAWALLVNALSFLAVLVALARVPPTPRPAPTESLGQGMLRGLRASWEEPGIRLCLGATLGVAALVAPFIGLVPVMALQVLHQGAAATSLLVGAQGLGAVTAAVFAGPLVERWGRRRLLEGALWLLGPCTALYWLSPSLPWAALALFCLGGAYMLTLTSLHTFIQSRAPAELQARVSSVYTMALGASYAVGVWLIGALADRLGVRLVNVGAALLVLAGLLLLRSLRPRSFLTLEA